MKNRSDYDKGSHEIAAPQVALADDILSHRIRARFQAKDYRPPLLPAVALEVHRLTQDPKSDFARVGKVLEQDPLLAARVLRIARSAAYGRATAVRSLQEAMGNLGLKTVSEVVWEAALKLKVFRSSHYGAVMESVRGHCTTTAYLCRLISRMTPIPTEYAFLCGLMHDIGLAAALVVLGEERDPGDAVDQHALSAALASLHEELSGLVARLWNMPSDVQIVLRNHHNLRSGGHIHPLSAIIAVAETVANDEDCGVTVAGISWDGRSEDGIDVAFQALQISPSQQKTLLNEARGLVRSLKAS